jgi:hypothetical protein
LFYWVPGSAFLDDTRPHGVDGSLGKLVMPGRLYVYRYRLNPSGLPADFVAIKT